jgi:two-component system sensor histidine kinase VicK
MINDFKLENVLGEVAEASHHGVVIYNLIENEVLYSNPVAVKLLGLRKGDKQADIEALLTQINPSDVEYVKNQYAVLKEKSINADVEVRLRTREGDEVYLVCSAHSAAEGSAIAVSVQDVTKSRLHEKYLVEFGAKKNTVLHTLMHHMSGALNLMQHLSTEAEKYVQTTNDKQLSVYLKLLTGNNSHSLALIEGLIKQEQERSPYVSVKQAKFDAIEMVSLIHRELEQSFIDRKFVYHHSANELYIVSDPVKLLQVLNNLTSNAIKFSPASEPILMSVSENDSDVIFSVQDFGIGIPSGSQSLIFERQQNFGRTGLNGEKSIGLGLFICKNLVDLLHGTIWFESKEGEGSTFFCSLPKPFESRIGQD